MREEIIHIAGFYDVSIFISLRLELVQNVVYGYNLYKILLMQVISCAKSQVVYGKMSLYELGIKYYSVLNTVSVYMICNVKIMMKCFDLHAQAAKPSETQVVY